MKHIMLDLETMGTGPKAAIVAIGACAFDPRADDVRLLDVFDKFYAQVSLESAMQAGLSITASTVLWWLKQSEEARKSTFADQSRSLNEACRSFAGWVNNRSGHKPKEVAVWGNGATFDNVIIRSAFEAVGHPVPWDFRNDKCYRTVINLLPEERRPKFERSGTAHNALDDAITQALYLQKVYKELGI